LRSKGCFTAIASGKSPRATLSTALFFIQHINPNHYIRSLTPFLLIPKTLITSILLKGVHMKYVQVVVEDAWLITLKKKCLDEGVTLAQKLLALIEREIGEVPWTPGK
jgi:hypothetical protein